jgi:hypothetical protein
VYYDHVIVCTGWRFDAAPFEADVRPSPAANGKHPAITPSYEAVGVPGLYFAGTAMHANDHRKSSGGFIHGFRYLTRALHRHLEELELEESADGTAPAASSAGASAEAAIAAADAATEVAAPVDAGAAAVGAPWPRRPAGGVYGLTRQLLHRATHAAGPFQIFGGMADVLLLRPVDTAAALAYSAAGVYLPDLMPPAPGAPASREAAAAPWETVGMPPSDVAALDGAVSGLLLEEVPVKLVPLKVGAWARQSFNSAGAAPTEYITLTLEFGPGATNETYGAGVEAARAARQAGPRGGGAAAKGELPWPTPRPNPGAPQCGGSGCIRNPFDPERVQQDVDEPHRSTFLHPVLRYYNTAVGGGSRPLLVQHIVGE